MADIELLAKLYWCCISMHMQYSQLHAAAAALSDKSLDGAKTHTHGEPCWEQPSRAHGTGCGDTGDSCELLRGTSLEKKTRETLVIRLNGKGASSRVTAPGVEKNALPTLQSG